MADQPVITIQDDGFIIIDGSNAGRQEDFLANYPQHAEQLMAELSRKSTEQHNEQGE